MARRAVAQCRSHVRGRLPLPSLVLALFTCVAAAPSGHNTTAAVAKGGSDSASARRLFVFDSQLPDEDTVAELTNTLTLVGASATPCAFKDCSEMIIPAGSPITAVEIDINPHTFGAVAPGLLVVSDTVTRLAAQVGNCPASAYGSGANSWGAAGAAAAAVNSGFVLQTGPMNFYMGGTFKLCYSADGSFGVQSDIVPIVINVWGVYDHRPECADDDTCVTMRPYRCYLAKAAHNNPQSLYGSPTSCIVDYSYEGAGLHGAAGNATWSSAFATQYDEESGAVVDLQPRACGSSAPEGFLCRVGGACDSGNYRVVPDAAFQNSSRLILPVARSDLSEAGLFRAYSVAMCYCPPVTGCDSATDFIQQIGVLHYYISKLCPPGELAQACDADFTTVARLQRFAVHVECPSDACGAHGGSRLKLVAHTLSNDVPSWHAASGCGTTEHGYSKDGKFVLPPAFNLDVTSVHGGYRQDFKVWNFKNDTDPLGNRIFEPMTAGFMFDDDGYAVPLEGAEPFDVCYCDDGCATAANWFKVGQLQVDWSMAPPPVVEVEAAALHGQLEQNQQYDQSVLFRVRGLPDSSSGSTQDIVVVLSLARSMSRDSKLDRAFATLERIISGLRVGDRLHLVTYGWRREAARDASSARLEFMGSATSPAERDRQQKMVAAVRAAASESMRATAADASDMAAGLREAELVLSKAAAAGVEAALRRVFFLTDAVSSPAELAGAIAAGGPPRPAAAASALAAAMADAPGAARDAALLERVERVAEGGVRVCAVAFGQDHNRVLVAAIAEAGRGDSLLVQGWSDVPSIDGLIAAEPRRPVVKRAELFVTPLGGAQALHVYGRRRRGNGPGPERASAVKASSVGFDAGGTSARLAVGDLYAGEERVVLLDVALRQPHAELSASPGVCAAHLTGCGAKSAAVWSPAAATKLLAWELSYTGATKAGAERAARTSGYVEVQVLRQGTSARDPDPGILAFRELQRLLAREEDLAAWMQAGPGRTPAKHEVERVRGQLASEFVSLARTAALAERRKPGLVALGTAAAAAAAHGRLHTALSRPGGLSSGAPPQPAVL